jgi:hypothetical protein
VGIERGEQRRPRGGRVAVAADGRETRRKLGRFPREHQPVHAAEEPQRDRVLVARVELVGEESPDRSAGADFAGHALEEVGVER